MGSWELFSKSYMGKKAILGHKGIAPWGLVGALFEILYGKEGDSWPQGEFDATPQGVGMSSLGPPPLVHIPRVSRVTRDKRSNKGIHGK